MNRFDVVTRAKLKRKKQAEQDEKNSKKQRVPWRWDAQSTSMKAITATTVSEMTFKQFLEAQYATSEERYDCPVCRTTFTERESKGKGISVRCPNCKHHFSKQGTSLGWLRSELSDEEIDNLPVTEARYYRQKEDWQEDVDEQGEATGACPRCKGYALYTTQGNTLATAKSFWECQECGHTGPERKY